MDRFIVANITASAYEYTLKSNMDRFIEKYC